MVKAEREQQGQQDRKKSWDFGRFVRTLFFFNDPTAALKKMLSGDAPTPAKASSDSWVMGEFSCV